MALLGWGGDSSCSRRRLRLLHDRGLIDKFRPARAAGSYGWNYRLTVDGWRLLTEHCMAVVDNHYKPADIHSIAYVEHDLQVNALVLDIAQRARAGESPLLDAMPFEWHGPRRGEIDPCEERRPESGEPSAQLAPSFLHGGSREGVIKPDATPIFGVQELRQAVLIEYDRTARPHKQLARLRRYDWFLTDGWTHGRFAFHKFARVLVFVALHERALQALVGAADEVLGATRGWPDSEGGDRLYVGRERVLFTTRERILCGDFRMLCAPRTLLSAEIAASSIAVRPSSHARSSSTSSALATQPGDDALAA